VTATRSAGAQSVSASFQPELRGFPQIQINRAPRWESTRRVTSGNSRQYEDNPTVNPR